MAPSTAQGRMIPIRVYSTEFEAQNAKAALEIFGVECTISGDSAIRLLVPEAEAALANYALRTEVIPDSEEG